MCIVNRDVHKYLESNLLTTEKLTKQKIQIESKQNWGKMRFDFPKMFLVHKTFCLQVTILYFKNLFKNNKFWQWGTYFTENFRQIDTEFDSISIDLSEYSGLSGFHFLWVIVLFCRKNWTAFARMYFWTLLTATSEVRSLICGIARIMTSRDIRGSVASSFLCFVVVPCHTNTKNIQIVLNLLVYNQL